MPVEDAGSAACAGVGICKSHLSRRGDCRRRWGTQDRGEGMTVAERGVVYLVGAGPGDPELLTVRALRLLESADVVLHDDLVAPEILKLIPSNARVQNVGKRCGTKTMRQEEINFLLVTLAASGLQVVR